MKCKVKWDALSHSRMGGSLRADDQANLKQETDMSKTAAIEKMNVLKSNGLDARLVCIPVMKEIDGRWYRSWVYNAVVS